MEVDYDKAFITLFGVSVAGMLFFTIWAAILRESPKRKKRIQELLAKEQELQKELKKNCIDRLALLNKMYSNGEVDDKFYYTQMAEIIEDLKTAGADDSFIQLLIGKNGN